MIVRQPTASEDRPAIATSSIAGAIALAAGLWLAHAAMGHPAPQAIEQTEQEREPEQAPIAAVPDLPPPSTTLAPALAHAPTPAGTSVASAPTPRPPPRTATGTASHVQHGRIAYLRCDGAPQTSGPFPCPRDAVLEATVASAIDQLIACTPPLPPGNADLVLEWDREVGTTVAITTRDTFPDDAIRTDGPGVVACITPALATLTTTIPGDRTRVGFRFELTN